MASPWRAASASAEALPRERPMASRGAGPALALQIIPDEGQDRLGIRHHGADRRAAARAPVAAVIHRQKIDPQPGVKGAQIVVVGHDFAVAVEEEQGRGGCAGGMQTGAEGNFGGHRDRQLNAARRWGRAGGLGARVKEVLQNFGTVQGGRN